MKNIMLAVCALVALAQAGCAAVTGKFNGTIVDVATGKPIPGAFAIASTSVGGADLVGSRSFCTDLDVVRADASGVFHLSMGNVLGNATRYVQAYAPGYSWARTRPDGTIEMKRFEGRGEDRKAELRRFVFFLQCGEVYKIAPMLRDMYSAIDREDRALKFDVYRYPADVGQMSEMLRGYEERGRKGAEEK